MPELEHHVGPKNQKIVRRLRLSRDMIWIFLGLAAVLAAIQFYVDPETISRSAVGKNLDGFIDDAWNVCWGVGGALIIAGVVSARGKIELIGQFFFLAGIVPDAIAVLVTVGGGPSFWIALTAGAANIGRIYYLTHITPKKR